MSGADVLIIGGGSAGSILANRLSADPARRVTLLEAGRQVTDPDVARPELWPFIQGRDYDWAYATEPQQHLAGRTLSWPRGKGLGGSSNLHAMAHMRGARSDFAVWVEATGSDRWSWDRMLPHFRVLESYSGGADAIHGADGPMPVMLPGAEVSPVVVDYLAAWESLGLRRISDHNSGEMIGATPNSLTIRNGKRVTVADAYLFPVKTRPNLTVVEGTLVHRLRLIGDRVSSVEVSRDGHDEIFHADTVILAAGSIGDPLLLMRSGVGDNVVLAAADVPTALNRPDVGRNLHDHLLGAGNLYRSRKTVPPTRLQLSESMTYLSAEGTAVTSGIADVVVGCVVAPSVSERYQSATVGLGAGDAYTLLFGVTHPTSRGSIRITGPDPSDAPVIDPAYLSTVHDRAMFRRALELARLVGNSGAMAPWRAEELLPGSSIVGQDAVDAFIAQAAITHHHPVGTCRMGADDDAVVDGDLRMRGIDNLFVVDASVFPAITTGPVHAAVMAVAESFAASFVG
ncbi:GMC family oxidoreductase [Rathayibacter soli]|uniref:GMC family oxidoreductase n=1 Tax=Rathayibacter soli TaxID=3144168 RepID=UPI0027E46B4F|nr:GMC oxidoreductase [Glaciibacter superstes]